MVFASISKDCWFKDQAHASVHWLPASSLFFPAMQKSRSLAHHSGHSYAAIITLAFLLLAPSLYASAMVIVPSAQRIVAHSPLISNTTASIPTQQTLWHIIRENDAIFSQLHGYLKRAPDIQLQLQSASAEVTFFAPENVAFGRLSPDDLALFEADISTHLKYHLLPRLVAEKDMHDGSQESTEQGQSVFITVQGAERDIWINDAYIVDGDHLAENGPPPPLSCSCPLSFDSRNVF